MSTLQILDYTILNFYVLGHQGHILAILCSSTLHWLCPFKQLGRHRAALKTPTSTALFDSLLGPCSCSLAHEPDPGLHYLNGCEVLPTSHSTYVYFLLLPDCWASHWDLGPGQLPLDPFYHLWSSSSIFPLDGYLDCISVEFSLNLSWLRSTMLSGTK